jgi:hypothetical protein
MALEANTADAAERRGHLATLARTGAKTPPPAPGSGHSVALPVWVRVVVVVALFKITTAATAVAIPNAGGKPPAAYLLAVGAFAVTGTWLMAFGRRDRRAVSLGIFFLLVASSFTGRLFLSAGDAAPALAPALRFLTRATVEAYQPFFFWLFVRDFPRTRRIVRSRWVVRWMAAATCWTGSILLLANLSLAFAVPGHDSIERWLGRNGTASLYWPILFVPMLLAVAHAVSQARRAPPDERRRVRIMVAGLVAGVAPIIAVTLASFVIPAFGRYTREHPAEAVRTLGLVVYPALLAIPIITAYAVLVHRAVDLRQIVRRALRYGLARYTLAAVAAAPLVIVTGALYARRGESLETLFAGPTGFALLATLAAGAVMVAFRRRALAMLDRRFFREQYDAQQILAGLVEEARAARTPAELAEVLERDIGRALHLRSVYTLVLDAASATLLSPRATLAPLPLGTPLARAMEAAAPLEIDWERPADWLAALPDAGQRWLSDPDLRLLLPVTRRDGSLLGALALGEKRSELPFSAEDRRLLAAIAGSVALWLEPRLPGAAWEEAGRGGEAAPGPSPRECEGCGLVFAAAGGGCPRCGGASRPAPVPLVLGGKFTLLERIGSGGMGVVYRAADLALHRVVAIKTLPQVSPREAARLREEARSMAAVSHPNLAAIHAAEAWNGIPMLVVEYLSGGTLDARLSAGPLPPGEAVALASELALALARLHEAGMLHRDVKPSNIGFAADGTPKLLDFGVARVLEAAREAAARPVEWLTTATPAPAATDPAEWGGTPLYLSPEAVMGHRPDVSFDLWALCMVLYESVAGRHPFADDPPARALLRIYDAAVPDVRELAPDLPPPLAAFLRDALHADARRRPAWARELHQRLTALR